jgi:hypothetical protein
MVYEWMRYDTRKASKKPLCHVKWLTGIKFLQDFKQEYKVLLIPCHEENSGEAGKIKGNNTENENRCTT